MLTYAALRDIQRKEMESAALVKLSENFYDDVATLLSRKKEEALASQSILAIKEYENIRKIVSSIHAKREEKIVLMAIRNRKIEEGITANEKEMLDRISGVVSVYRVSIEGIVNNSESLPKKIKITKYVEQYKGLDNSIYGPFSVGDQPSLPKDEVEWLLKAHMAEIV